MAAVSAAGLQIDPVQQWPLRYLPVFFQAACCRSDRRQPVVGQWCPAEAAGRMLDVEAGAISEASVIIPAELRRRCSDDHLIRRERPRQRKYCNRYRAGQQNCSRDPQDPVRTFMSPAPEFVHPRARFLFKLPYFPPRCAPRFPGRSLRTLPGVRGASLSPNSTMPSRPRSRRVRAMMLRMAVLTFPVHGVDRRRITRIAGMTSQIRVALLAQSGPRDLQQKVVVGAVCIVAIQAILAHRRMLERAAAFSAWHLAGVGGGLFQQRFAVVRAGCGS